MILMIDNYDSFTYNLVQYFMQLGEEVAVYRNDEITVTEAEKLEFDYLVISPGPGNPSQAGCSKAMIQAFTGRKPILGVCLGHQAMGEIFGGRIIGAQKIMHGKSDMITHDGKTIFAGLPNPLRVIRYHSLAIERQSLSKDFEISASSQDGEIMAIRHRKYPVEGVQFHPESIGTEGGMKILRNFLGGAREIPPVKDMLKKIVMKQDLTLAEAGNVMEQITDGTMTAPQIGSFLTALTMKGVTVEELSGFAKVLREKALSVSVPDDIMVVDTCGTGGDGHGMFNVSTAAAFVTCGAGVAVAKHGNRSITSKSGSADVLEALGVKIDMNPQQAAEALTRVGMCFLFAPNFHPAFKNIMGPRRELGFRTIFNLMGPLLNPAKVKAQVMGVFDPDKTELIAEVLNNLGVKHALVVHGSDGCDEITLTGPTKVTELNQGWIRTWQCEPREYGFNYCNSEDLKGGEAIENAEMILRILDGEKGPRRDIVLLNAAAAILAADHADTLAEAILKARESIDSGSAKQCLEKLIAIGKSK